ncbi:class I SAM-dependent methyltransferase [Ilumatobacter sp.]|uniref:class I SAM-dependent methyltransferase n=1 Tax=Ilumatobacter sp. TaxID=1967498 RepID=UPI003C32C986
MDVHLVELADHPGATEPEPFAGPDHPMRRLTRATAFGGPWTDEDAARVQKIFDGLAPTWSADHVDPTKNAPIADALDRGGVPVDADWLEVGSGTGAGARIVAPSVGSLVCCDLSAEMLRHAPDLAPRVRADASTLPFSDRSFDVVLLVNMLLFPAEVDRVLRSEGAVVWVNTLGDQTPIHLPPSDVIDALPGVWTGMTAAAGTGFWLTARRAF